MIDLHSFHSVIKRRGSVVNNIRLKALRLAIGRYCDVLLLPLEDSVAQQCSRALSQYGKAFDAAFYQVKSMP